MVEGLPGGLCWSWLDGRLSPDIWILVGGRSPAVFFGWLRTDTDGNEYRLHNLILNFHLRMKRQVIENLSIEVLNKHLIIAVSKIKTMTKAREVEGMQYREY